MGGPDWPKPVMWRSLLSSQWWLQNLGHLLANKDGSRNAPVSQFYVRDTRSLLGIQTSFFSLKREQPWEGTAGASLEEEANQEKGMESQGSQLEPCYTSPEVLTPSGLQSHEPMDVIFWKLVCIAFPVTCSAKDPSG